MNALAAIGTKVLGGGFINGVAQLLINFITNDDWLSDVALAFVEGGVSPLIPASNGPGDAAGGLLVGVMGQTFWNCWQAFHP